MAKKESDRTALIDPNGRYTASEAARVIGRTTRWLKDAIKSGLVPFEQATPQGAISLPGGARGAPERAPAAFYRRKDDPGPA